MQISNPSQAMSKKRFCKQHIISNHGTTITKAGSDRENKPHWMGVFVVLLN